MAQKFSFSEDFFTDKIPFLTEKNRPWSTRLAVNTAVLPVSAEDSVPLGKALLQMLGAVVLFSVGFLIVFALPESQSFIKEEASVLTTAATEPVSARITGWVIMSGAIGWLFYRLLSLSFKKTFVIGNRYVTVNVRNFFVRKSFMEALSAYEGVRYRSLPKGRGDFLYIIDLKHKDAMKNIPLYVGENGKNIWTRVTEYAERFNLPVLFADGEEDNLPPEKEKAKKQTSFVFTVRRVKFPYGVFFLTLVFLAIIDVLLFWSHVVSSAAGVGLVIPLSSLLVFLIPFGACFKKEEIKLLKNEIMIKETVFSFFPIRNKKVKYKDIVSTHIIKISAKKALIFNTENGAVLLGNGVEEEQLASLKRQIEARL